MKSYISGFLAITICLVFSFCTTITYSQSGGRPPAIGEAIDEVYFRQEDALKAGVLVLDLSKTGLQIKLDIAGNTGLSARRKAVIIKGMELIHFTKYNLGSKAANKSLKKPTYLDCSGFVQWAVLRATGYDIGHGTARQYADSMPITESDLQIGDLGFKKPGGVENLGGGNHVAIFVGYDKSGKKLWLHCTSGSQNGVNISKNDGLVYYARPKCYEGVYIDA